MIFLQKSPVILSSQIILQYSLFKLTVNIMNGMETDHLAGVNLQVDTAAGRQITDAGKWAKFISIVVFCFCGLALLGILLSSAYMASISRALYPFLGEYANFGMGAVIAIFVIVIAVMVFLYYLLFVFSQKAPEGVATEDAGTLNKGLRSLKLYFIISTIIAILFLLLSLMNFSNSNDL
jgi:hypothetical protein